MVNEKKGVYVTLLDANHCPGACLLLFRVGQGQGGESKRYLHTGKQRMKREGCAFSAVVCIYLTIPPPCVLYTCELGDMRYHPKMQSYPALKQQEGGGNKIDTIFLDTTYSHPRYDHPPQADAMEAMVTAIIERLKGEGQW